MTSTWDKIHKCLGMTTNYSFLVKVKFSMENYIGNMLDVIPEDMRGEVATLSTHHIFYIPEDMTKLPQTNADLLYHFVVQILYLSKQSRPEIQSTV